MEENNLHGKLLQSKHDSFEDFPTSAEISQQQSTSGHKRHESILISSTTTDPYIKQNVEEINVAVKPPDYSILVKPTEYNNNIEKKTLETMMPEMILRDPVPSIVPKIDKQCVIEETSAKSGVAHHEMGTDWQKFLKQLYERIIMLEQKNRELSIIVENHQATIVRLQNQIQLNNEEALTKNCNGIFIWRIDSFSERLGIMISNSSEMMYSPGFYTNPSGYKLCARLNVSLKNSEYISIVLHIMKSENDDVLDWPFHGTIIFTLIHPTIPHKSIKEEAVSSPDLEAFQKPIDTLNKRSFGYTEFISLSELGEFIHNDRIIFRIEVKT